MSAFEFEILQVEKKNGKIVAFCTKCNHRIRAKNKHGIRVAIGMHYRSKHNSSINVQETRLLCVISKPILA